MNKENVEPQENSLGTDTSKNEQSNKNKTSISLLHLPYAP